MVVLWAKRGGCPTVCSNRQASLGYTTNTHCTLDHLKDLERDSAWKNASYTPANSPFFLLYKTASVQRQAEKRTRREREREIERERLLPCRNLYISARVQRILSLFKKFCQCSSFWRKLFATPHFCNPCI